MRLIISNYRYRTDNQMIIAVEGGEPQKLIGKKVVWTSKTGKKFVGNVTRTHGKHAVRARFSKGLPGQAVGTEVKLTS